MGESVDIPAEDKLGEHGEQKLQTLGFKTDGGSHRRHHHLSFSQGGPISYALVLIRLSEGAFTRGGLYAVGPSAVRLFVHRVPGTHVVVCTRSDRRR